jgi:hypothetical protein
MPYNWVRIPSSPPIERWEQVKGILGKYEGASLAFDEIFYDREGNAYALVEVPADPCEVGKLLADLKAIKVLFLVDAHEKAEDESAAEA